MKNIGILLGTILMGIVFLAQSVRAETTSDIALKIQQLQAQIQELQKQLLSVQSQNTFCPSFTTNLRIGDSGDAVATLHKGLLRGGFSVASDEVNKTYFGESTASAVVGFQEQYRNDVLAPHGLIRGTGYVGATTREKLNRLYQCNATGGIKPMPIEKTISISNIQSASNPVGVVDSGHKASIYGTGLSGPLTIKLGAIEPKYVKTKGTSDTYAEFIVPEYKQRIYTSVVITNEAGLTSAPYDIEVLVPTARMDTTDVEKDTY